jgi:hypothetical protein
MGAVTTGAADVAGAAWRGDVFSAAGAAFAETPASTGAGLGARAAAAAAAAVAGNGVGSSSITMMSDSLRAWPVATA